MSGKLRVLISAILLAPAAAFGLGLGEIRLGSALNEPFSAEIDLVALAARRRQNCDLVRRKLALGKNVEHLAPDISRRPCDHDPVTHDKLQLM